MSKLSRAPAILRDEGAVALVRRAARHVCDRLAPVHRPNTIEANRETWSQHDWSRLGEEWSNNAEWKASFVKHVLEPHVPPGTRVLEIGPGGGRWTEILLARAKHVTIVDLTERCIELCTKRFADAKNLTARVNDGRDLSFVPDASIDRIFSWDVFVHIQASDVAGYVEQFPRILAPGGRALIHHSRLGKWRKGWRSDMTAERMRELAAQTGLTLVSQATSWDEGRVPIYGDPDEPDVISILAKP